MFLNSPSCDLSCFPVFVCVFVFLSLLLRLLVFSFRVCFVNLSLQHGCLWPVTSQNFSEHSTFKLSSVSLGLTRYHSLLPTSLLSGGLAPLPSCQWIPGEPWPTAWATSVQTRLDLDRARAKAQTPAQYTVCEEQCGLFFFFLFFF